MEQICLKEYRCAIIRYKNPNTKEVINIGAIVKDEKGILLKTVSLSELSNIINLHLDEKVERSMENIYNWIESSGRIGKKNFGEHLEISEGFMIKSPVDIEKISETIFRSYVSIYRAILTRGMASRQVARDAVHS